MADEPFMSTETGSPTEHFQPQVQFQPTAPPTETPKLSFSPDPAPVLNVPADVATDRAAKAYEGIRKYIPADYNDLRTKMLDGLEDSQRARDARAIDAVNQKRRMDAIIQASNSKGGPLTQDELNQVDYQLFRDDLYDGKVDPRSVYEEKYAHAYLDYLKWAQYAEDNHWLTQAKAEIPNQVARTEEEAADYIKWNEYVNKRLEDVKAKLQERGFGATAGSFAASGVPFLTSYMLRGNQPYEGFSLTTSGSLESQRLALVRLPFNERKDRFDEIMNNLEGYNLDYAAQFASAMTGQSTFEQLQHTFGDFIDITSIPAIGAGRALVRRAVLYNNVRRAYRDMAASAIRPVDRAASGLPAEWSTPRIVEVRAANAAGDLERSAVSQESTNVVNRLAGSDRPQAEALDGIASVFRGHRDQVGAGPGQYGQAIVNRIQEGYDRFTQNFLDIMENIIRVERIPAVLASRTAVRRILDGIRDEYRNLGNSIINQSEIYWDSIRNTYYSDLVLGQVDGTAFRSEGQARAFATQARLQGYRLDTQGAGVVIRMPKPVKENTAWLRDALLTADTQVPDSALQSYVSWLGWARTPDETLAAQNTWNRKTAVYAQNVLKDLYKRNAQNMLELVEGRVLRGNKWSPERRRQFQQWQQMIDAQRNEFDRNGLRGRFFDTPMEIESYYWRNFNRAPSELELAAYFDFKRTVMMDWALRNLEVYKYMSRVGTEEWGVTAYRTATRRTEPLWIRGVKQIDMPPEDAIVMWMGHGVGDERIFRGNMPGTVRGDLRDRIQRGELQLVRLYAPGHQPFAGWSPRVRPNDRIEYVISDKFHNRPLSFQVLPIREGGHVEYDYNHYIKQARIIPQFTGRRGGRYTFQYWYEGDTTVMPVQLRQMGQDAADILNTAREHLRAGDHAAAQAALSPLPIDFNEFRQWFRATRSPTGARVPPRLSLTEPFHVVPSNRTIADLPSDALSGRFIDQITGRSNLRDGTREGSLAAQFQVPFTQERDAYELQGLRNDGTRYRPLYRVEPANMVNPLTSMNRGLNRIINSFFMDDYKLMSVEHWLQQAAAFMRVDGGIAAIRTSPFYFFHNADSFWIRDTGRTAQAQIEKLKIAAKEIKLFMGEQSTWDAWVQSATTRMADDIYSIRSPYSLRRLGLNIGHWGLANIQRASDYARAAVFHSTMGLFNWVQALVQNLTYVNIFGISGPAQALNGTLAATLHQMSRMAGRILPDVIDHFDRIASRISGWRPGELREAHDWLARTGFDHVGGEHILANYNFEPSIFRSSVGHFLDAGGVFFRGGERHMRFGAWYTAFKEWRNAHPTGPITNENIREILNRADLLSGNMTNASRSMLQRGAMSWSTQFLGYQLRLAEQMLGKRLSRGTKARLFATNAIMYGVPTAAGLAAIPFGEAIRQHAISNNYVVGDSWYKDVLMNGLPAYIGAVISGGGDPQKGTQMNVGDRYGSPGLDILRDALYSDKKMIELATGATGSAFIDAFSQTNGFLRVLWSIVHDGGEAFPYTHDDLINASRMIASVNNATRGILAVNEGVWRTKKGIAVEPISPTAAILRTLTGLQSQEASDVIRKQYNFEADQTAQKEAEKAYVREFVAGVQAMNDNDPSQADKHFARAKAFLEASNYPRNLYGRVISMGVNASQYDMITRSDWNYYLRNVPAGQEQGRIEAFEKAQQLRAKRGQ